MRFNDKPKRIAAPVAAALVALGVGQGAIAAPSTFSTVLFTMYDPTGAVAGTPDPSVTGTFDIAAKTFTLASTTPFFGLLWSTHTGTLYLPGTYQISTADTPGVTCGTQFSICAGDGSPGGGAPVTVTFVVPAGKIGGHIKFAWGATDGIDVFMIWDATGKSIDFGTTSPNVPADGILGYKMVDGPFKGFSANFDTTPPITQNVDTSVPTQTPTSLSGTYGPGGLATAVGSTDGSGLTVADVGSDATMEQQCVGGCFDFKVTGVTAGASVKTVLLLNAPIPAGDFFHKNIVYRKKINGTWQDFDTSTGDVYASAPAISTNPLKCPGPGSFSYGSGINAGDRCLQLTIKDGGPNDADGAADGTVTDPGGIGVGASVVSTIADPSFEGGSVIGGSGAIGWGALAGLFALLGFRRRKTLH